MKSSLEPYQNLKVNALYEWNKNVLLLGVDKIGFSFYDKKWEKIPVIKKYQNIMNYLNNGLEMCNLYSNIRLKRNYGLVHNLAD